MTGERGAAVDAAVVLSGGSGRRLGGVDKATLEVGGRSLLDRVLDAVGDEPLVVGVGPGRTTARAVAWTREDPPGGGPAAGLAAALSALPPLPGDALVALLAVDLPFLDAAALRSLAAALHPADDGALLVDEDGRRQLLCGVWRLAALRRAVDGAAGPPPEDRLHGVPLRRVLAPLAVREVSLPAPPGRAPWADCDTAEDIAAARRAVGTTDEGAAP